MNFDPSLNHYTIKPIVSPVSLTYQYINQKDWFNGLLSFWFKPPVPYYRPNGMVWCFRPTVPHRPDGFGRLHGLRLERRGMRCLSSGTPLPCLRFCTSGCSERPHKTTARSNRGFIAVLASPAVTLRRLPKQVLLRVCRIGRTENLQFCMSWCLESGGHASKIYSHSPSTGHDRCGGKRPPI